jgi:mannosyltransferase
MLENPLGLLTAATVLDPPLRRPPTRLPPLPERPLRAPRRRERQTDPAIRRDRRLTWLAIAVPCLVAALLCSWELSTRSLWLDEGASVSIASQHGAALWHAIAHDGGNMLVYYLVLHVLIGLFGDAEVVIRMPSVISTVVTVGTVAVLGVRMFGDRRLAFASAMLAAVSLPLVFWGQDARGYAPLVTFCALSFLAFHEVVAAPKRPSMKWLAVYVISTVLAVYMGFVGALVLPAQLLLLGVRPRQGRWVLGAMAACVLSCIPLLVLATARGSSQLFWVPRPNMEGIGQTLRWLTSAGMPPNFHRSSTATLTMIISIVVLFCAFALTARRCQRAFAARKLDSETWAMLVALSWLVVPIVLSVAESAAGQPILLFRNAIICLPAVALAMAWVLLRRSTRWYIGWAAVGGLLLLRALQLAPSYGVSPENWKAAEHYVSERTRPGDCIAFYPLDGRMPFDYYVRAGESAAGAPVMSTGVRVPRPVEPAKLPWSSTPPFVEDYQTPSNSQINNIEKTCRRLWFVASHEGQKSGPSAESRMNFVKYRVLGATLQLGYQHHHRVNFGWAAQIEVELLSGRVRSAGADPIARSPRGRSRKKAS